MDLATTIAGLDADRTWSYVVDIANLSAPTLELNDRSARAVAHLLALTNAPDIDEDTYVETIVECRSLLAFGSKPRPATTWCDLLQAGRAARNTTNPASVYADLRGDHARRIGVTDHDQWKIVADHHDVPAEHRDTWAGLAPDWTGTPEELTAACPQLHATS